MQTEVWVKEGRKISSRLVCGCTLRFLLRHILSFILGERHEEEGTDGKTPQDEPHPQQTCLGTWTKRVSPSSLTHRRSSVLQTRRLIKFTEKSCCQWVSCSTNVKPTGDIQTQGPVLLTGVRPEETPLCMYVCMAQTVSGDTFQSQISIKISFRLYEEGFGLSGGDVSVVLGREEGGRGETTVMKRDCGTDRGTCT